MGAELADGLRVVAHGRPTFWTRGGSLQLQVDDETRFCLFRLMTLQASDLV